MPFLSLRGVAAVLALATLGPLAGCATARPAARAARADSLAPGWSRRAFVVRGHGRIVLAIPPGWTVKEAEDGGELSAPAVVLEGPGSAYRAILTPLWNPGEPESPQARLDTAQLFADLARRKALAGSVERELQLRALEGPGVRGFWFVATDRELAGRQPGPDEWRSVLQGTAAVGPVLLVFALLDNGPGPQRTALLDVVRTARHVPDAAAAGDAGDGDEVELESVPDVETVPLSVGWPGKSWAVLVDLPEFHVAVPRGGAAAAGPLVWAADAQVHILATITIRDGGGARDATACREQALERIGRVPRVSGMVRVEGTAARAAYVVTSEKGVAALHLNAFLARDGLCANVHLSMLDPSPADRARLEAIIGSVRFGEEL